MQSSLALLLIIPIFSITTVAYGQDDLTDSEPCGIGMHPEQVSNGQIECVDDVAVSSQTPQENPVWWIGAVVVLLLILAIVVKKKKTSV